LRSEFDPRAAHLEQSLDAAVLLRREYRFQQAWEAVVQIVLAEGEEAAAPFGAGSDDAALAEDAEVVGEGCLREAQVEGAAGALVAVGELADDLESGRVAQRVEYGRELELLTGWVVWLSHAFAADKTVVESSMIV
jgi:hypothetical protein